MTLADETLYLNMVDSFDAAWLYLEKGKRWFEIGKPLGYIKGIFQKLLEFGEVAGMKG